MHLSFSQLDPKLWLLLAPLALIQFGLQIFCLVKLVRSQKPRYLNKPVWALLIIFVNLIGSILYLALEGGQNERD
jgi:heme/copper-type cytochrome/quinol oxidase subunit 4